MGILINMDPPTGVPCRGDHPDPDSLYRVSWNRWLTKSHPPGINMRQITMGYFPSAQQLIGVFLLKDVNEFSLLDGHRKPQLIMPLEINNGSEDHAATSKLRRGGGGLSHLLS